MTTPQISIARRRFGYGLHADQLDRDALQQSDPRQFLLRQLDAFETFPAAIRRLPRRTEIATSLLNYREFFRGMNRKNQSKDAMDGAEAQRKMKRDAIRQYYLDQISARYIITVTSETDFAERLVHFWANHFAISIDKVAMIGIGGLLEFEAIRPHITGRFSDMLAEVIRHPAMLTYLDQAGSVGPDSMGGKRRAARGRKRAGLNENLAREILELHTLGVKGGYTQVDVTEFAKALTGFSINNGRRRRNLGGKPGDFLFNDRVHQPGTRRILGNSYAQEGEAQASAILSDLAVHPSTARHLSMKLARHFVADDPPSSLVEKLTHDFLRTGGDLRSWYNVLISAPEAWQDRQQKFLTPWEWSIAASRAAGLRKPLRPKLLNRLFMQLGQPAWKPGSPAGFDDIAESWLAPDALFRRAEAAPQLMRFANRLPDARIFAPKALGGALRSQTATALAQAESPGQAMALLTMAPEFLRR